MLMADILMCFCWSISDLLPGWVGSDMALRLAAGGANTDIIFLYHFRFDRIFLNLIARTTVTSLRNTSMVQ